MSNPGRMNKKLILQTVDDTTETISDLATVWAKVKPMTGQRALVYEQLQMGVWYDIETTFRPDLALVPGDPVAFESETLTVHSIINENEADRKWLIKAYVKRG